MSRPRSPGYRRSRRAEERGLDRLWAILSDRRAPLTTHELAELADISPNWAKHLLAAGRRAGWIVEVGAGPLGTWPDLREGLYMLADEAPVAAPVIVLESDGRRTLRASEP